MTEWRLTFEYADAGDQLDTTVTEHLLFSEAMDLAEAGIDIERDARELVKRITIERIGNDDK